MLARYTPYLLLPDVVREVVEPGIAGAYVLGSGLNFEVGYVGRSDWCVRRRLAGHNHLYQFDYFIVRRAVSAAEAFAFECEAWHALEHRHAHMLNRYHPAAPAGTGFDCPYCKFAMDVRAYFAGLGFGRTG
jgi:hypothetical protein